MNWLQKTATPIHIFRWMEHTLKALDVQVPGEWNQQYGGSVALDMHHAGYIGREIMIQPNSNFFVSVDMKRRGYTTRHLDSNIGHKDIAFECQVKASRRDKWPTFGKVIGNKLVDTPAEIAEFVQDAIENYRPDNGGDENVEPGITPTPSENVPVPTGVLQPA